MSEPLRRENSQLKKGNLKEILISINLGTSVTTVSCIESAGEPVVLKLEDGKETIPTALYFEKKGKYCIGEEARRRGMKNPQAYIHHFKMDFAKEKAPIYSIVSEDGDSFPINLFEASKLFLSKVIRLAQEQIKVRFADENYYISKAVMTAPAALNPFSKDAIKKSAVSSFNNTINFVANFSECYLMQEPKAIAVALLKDYPRELRGKRLMIFDFGGGSLDISVLAEHEGIFRYEDVPETFAVGGNLLTECIASDMIHQVNVNRIANFGEHLAESPEAFQKGTYRISQNDYLRNYEIIWRTAEEFKIKISEYFNWNDGSWDDDASIIKTDYALRVLGFDGNLRELTCVHSYSPYRIRELIQQYIKKAVDNATGIIERMNSNGKPIDYLFFAGGSSKLPMIATAFAKKRKEYEKFPIFRRVQNCDTLIVRGAVIAGQKNQHAVGNELHHEIGIHVHSAGEIPKFVRLLSPAPLPIVNAKPYTIGIEDNRTDFQILVKERDNTGKLHPIGSFVIDELPESRGRQATLKLTMNEEGILNMTVDILSNGIVISHNQTMKKRSNFL